MSEFLDESMMHRPGAGGKGRTTRLARLSAAIIGAVIEASLRP